MKKAISILLVLIMLLSLAACSATQEDANSFVVSMVKKAEDCKIASSINSIWLNNVDQKNLEKLQKKPDLLSVAFADKIADSSYDFLSCCKLVLVLEKVGIRDEAVKEQFRIRLENEQARVFSASDSELAEYINRVEWVENSKYYVSIIDYFPYSEMKDAIQTLCENVICQDGIGGYYDSRKSDYPDEHYWYSPLFETKQAKGEVGFQEITITNLFVGDLIVSVTQKVFYDTKPSDYGNSVSARFCYKDRYVSSDYKLITKFLENAKTENTYFAGKNLFLIVNTGSITVFDGNELYDISYN